MWMGRRVQLSHFTCSRYGADCHLLVPFNFQGALILGLKCFQFLIPIILYTQESPQRCFILGAPKHHFPLERHLPKAVSQHPGWKSVGSRAKARGRGWAVVWKRPWNTLRLQAGCCRLDAFWALEHVSKTGEPFSGPTTRLGCCVFWTVSTPNVGWRMWLLIHTLPLTDHKMSEQEGA